MRLGPRHDVVGQLHRCDDDHHDRGHDNDGGGHQHHGRAHDHDGTRRARGAPQVTGVTARGGGGSGEIAVRWPAVDGATGYRVHRADTPDGPFTVTGDIDLMTGQTTLAPDATNLWSSSPGQLEYVEVVTNGASARYFRVGAYNAAGEGPLSDVECGAPTLQPQC